ncbi:cation acetate symporter [Lipingzhangella sp. LS1_29]|uniref:Cation acetate symporter n=1 Tax=Lipingzhangella rawalii TaxID=2055835 RepID=A0ABU2H0B9_9ACTN|nr:cation acetate symporter [Lipingzhangella rawalii]MDS1268748.1 cation acetate symporter [Lipingzhangella rawalii]
MSKAIPDAALDTTVSLEFSSHALTLLLCALFVALTLGITVWARRNTRGAVDFYAGGRRFGPVQNGLALTGDYLSAASFLGIAGMIALWGYDGFLYSVGFLVAWMLVLPLAQLMRNTGRFTMADLPGYRMPRMRVRAACACATVTVCVFYLLAQMVAAGALVAMLVGTTATSTRIMGIVGVGVLMIVYVMYGGMKGATWLQIIKAVLLLLGSALVCVLVLAQFGFDPSRLLTSASDASSHGTQLLQPGLYLGQDVPGDTAQTLVNKLDLFSLGLGLVLGTAALPHVLIRFYTVPDGTAARSSVRWAIALIGAFYLMTLVLGFGAAAIVGRDAILDQDRSGNTAVPQLALALGESLGGAVGGAVLLAFISAVALATILAVVASLTLASSMSLAHDVFGHIVMWGRPKESQEVGVARVCAAVVGVVAIGLAILARDLNVAFLVGLAFSVAAAANLPVILLSLFWRRFNSRGVLWGIAGGLVSSITLVLLSPVVSGKTDPQTGENLSLLPAWINIQVFPLENPGIVAIPVGFLCAVLGTLTCREYDPERYQDLQLRSLTGSGAARS